MRSQRNRLRATRCSMRTHLALVAFAIAASLVAAPSVWAQDPEPSAESLDRVFPKAPYSPYADRDFPTHPLWGDTHLHTGLSMDAGAFGARLMPDDAYKFAKGAEVVSSTGQRARLSRPLDFLVVADHSDNMGFFPRLYAGDAEMLRDPIGRKWYDMIQQGGQEGVKVAVDVIERFSNGTFPEALQSLPGTAAYRSAWEQTIDAAEAANEPGRFTAFIGWEWTSNTMGNNLHRVLIYRDGKDRAGRLEPYTTLKPLGSDNPVDLWKWMQNYVDQSGGDILAIAHNGNLSNGLMFPVVDPFTKRRIGKKYAQTRARWEPLYEVTQIKGDGETHPFLSPNDEFADYETWAKGNLDLSTPKQDEMLQYEYARSALKIGLELEQKTGTNPYKFGMIGSTDSHTGLATAEEDNFFGKHSGAEPSPTRIDHPMAKTVNGQYDGWAMVASGYAAVWAKENTRASIFDAMMRKETYATTGPRIIVRFFGGWDFAPEDANTRSPARTGYTKGVPMGGDLTAAPPGKSPTFLVAALKDSIGANLDRIQIVKGWQTSKGQLEEHVYDVALSDGRKADANGRVPLVGNTVDIANATWRNSIGDTELIATWTDPDFDPKQRAFYYARVIEIPKPRWTAYDAKYYELKPDPEVPMTTQDRAYTAPIWYTP
jgi:hypothetical protein